jgi:uncharacterized membrane protein YedE/YeeE
VSALLAGLLFGAGLLVSGMTRPAKVLAFLDVFGEWDPSLAFVMAGAIGVHAVAYRWSRSRVAPVLAQRFETPASRQVDARLLGGAALFGVGWGLGGYCPGPSIVALATLAPGVLVFVVGLVVGSLLVGERASRREGERGSGDAPSVPLDHDRVVQT